MQLLKKKRKKEEREREKRKNPKHKPQTSFQDVTKLSPWLLSVGGHDVPQAATLPAGPSTERG